MASENVSNSNQLVNTSAEVSRVDGKPLLTVNNPGLYSSSSSSEFGNGDLCDDSSAKSEHDGALSSETESLSSPDVSQTPQWSMISASPRAGSSLLSQELAPQNPDWNSFSTMKSPPVQTMGRPTGYDPNRIPVSIFSTKKTGNMDWSVASNESLFSIHMGNNSFSRDNAMFLGKSGELSRIEEWNNSPSNLQYVPETKSGELNSFPSSLPPLIEATADEENCVKLGETCRKGQEDSGSSPKTAPTKTVEDLEKEKPAMTEVRLPPSVSNVSDGKVSTRFPSSPPRPSDDSGNSSSSFAFPLLVNDGGKTGSLKSVPKKQQSEPNPSDATPKASETRWFSRFSCWPFCR
ncbi:unnamed protein product [Fraxinus pennsylvanica]|uniref:Uncharacterized protein n=1 Tax=Fraxinus pennsylvanica TaxID=56036 RepID=A0AAD2E7Y4_9LAMI|nr:unnamed protein product [Fraxinus pennsylvanica]